MCYFWKTHTLFVFLFCLIFLCACVIVVLWCKITAHCEYFRVGGDLSQWAAACPTKHFPWSGVFWASQVAQWQKKSSCQCRRCKRRGFDPWVRKIPWSRKWQPTLVFLAWKFHMQRSLVGCSLWGHRAARDWATEHIHKEAQGVFCRWEHYSVGEPQICPETELPSGSSWTSGKHIEVGECRPGNVQNLVWKHTDLCRGWQALGWRAWFPLYFLWLFSSLFIKFSLCLRPYC